MLKDIEELDSVVRIDSPYFNDNWFQVITDGRGLQLSRLEPSHGLSIMRTRAEISKGQLTIVHKVTEQ
jgi:signal transduction histidine kinase